MFLRHLTESRILRAPEGEGAGGGGEPAAAAPAAAAPAAPAAAAAPAAPSTAALSVNDALAKAGEGKPEGAKPEGEAGKEGEGQPKEGETEAQPIVYTDFTLPPQYQAAPEAMEAATAVFKELNLPQEHAQKIVDAYFQIDQMVNAGWIQDIEGQFEAFSKDADFYKDGKLTPAAEQAYGAIRGQTAETQAFFDFLNKNGGLFHPGFSQIVKQLSKGVKESSFKGGEPGKDGESWKGFYNKSNHN